MTAAFALHEISTAITVCAVAIAIVGILLVVVMIAIANALMRLWVSK